MKRLGFEKDKNTKSSAPPRLRGKNVLILLWTKNNKII